MTRTDFTAMKAEVEASPDKTLWDIIRRSILQTEESTIRYVYARAELNKRGALVG